MQTGKTRIKDIAKLAGVSIGTVDRVLHNRGEVADRTREKVLEIIKELNYSPNIIAQTLKTRKDIFLISILPEPTAENPFWSMHSKGISKAMAELVHFPVSLKQLKYDISSEIDFQRKAIEALESNPDGLLFAPVFKKESISFCNHLSDKGIPFAFIDGCIDEIQFLSYTGEDIFQSGRVAGHLIHMLSQPESDILIINIAGNLQNFHHLNSRTEGFISYFNSEKNNGSHILKLSIPIPEPGIIKNDLHKTFYRNNKIKSIFVTGSKSFKIADFLETEGIKDINLIGYDIHEKNTEHLKSGTIKFLIGQRPEEQAYKGVKKLFDYLSFNRVPERIEYLPVDIITAENVNSFL